MKYIITSVLNNSTIYSWFWLSLKNYAEHLGARLIVLPFRAGTYSAEEISYPSILEDYMIFDDLHLSKNLLISPSMQPGLTAVHPTSGIGNYGGHKSVIFPHPKVALDHIATGYGDHPKMLATTGSLSRLDHRYKGNKSREKARFHHAHAALFVETRGSSFSWRYLHAGKKGRISDLDLDIRPSSIQKKQIVDTIVLGDLHFGPNTCKRALSASEDMVQELRPSNLVLHDALDFYTRSHHDNIQHSFLKFSTKRLNVKSEIIDLCNYLERISKKVDNLILVPSNHNDHLTQWLTRSEPSEDMENLLWYHELKFYWLRDILSKGSHYPALYSAIHMLRPELARRIKMLTRGTSFKRYGIELGYHGDIGTSGTRGSARNLARTGSKSVIGHAHSARIVEGCYQVGTLTKLELDYTRGSPSAWTNTNCVIYRGGKRTLLNIVNGKWR